MEERIRKWEEARSAISQFSQIRVQRSVLVDQNRATLLGRSDLSFALLVTID